MAMTYNNIIPIISFLRLQVIVGFGFPFAMHMIFESSPKLITVDGLFSIVGATRLAKSKTNPSFEKISIYGLQFSK